MRAFVVDQPRTGALRALNYAPSLERIRRAGSNSARPLRQLVKAFGPAYGTMFTRLDCHPDHGVRLLSQTDTFAAEPLGRIVRKDSLEHPDRHEIRRWQVLIAGAGQMGESNLFGKSIIADARLEGGFVGPDTFVLGFEEPGSDLNLWTYAVLNSSLGVQGILSSAYGTSIPHLRGDILGTIPIPDAPADLMRRVANLIRKTVAYRESYLRDMVNARALFERLPEMQAAHEMCVERRRRTVLWNGPFPSLCAWTFASTAGALAFLRARLRSRVSDMVEPGGIFRGGRYARVPCSAPYGVDFMSQRDAFMIRPSPQVIRLPSADLMPQPGTIMVGGQGTLGEGEIFGRAALVSDSGAKCAWTEHLLRIIPRKGEEARLYAFLTTIVGFRLLRSTAVGTKLLSMRPDILLDLPIPVLPHGDAKRVDALVRAAITARAAADVAEAEATSIIEKEVLPQWLA